MKEVGQEALDRLGHILKIRGEVAVKTAQAACLAGDSGLMKKCWYEAFYSNSTVTNYLRLFTDGEAINTYKALAESRITKLQIFDGDYNPRIVSEMAKNNVSQTEFKYLHFFSGNIDKVKDWCMEQKNPLGWSSKFIGDGVDLMLLYLYNNDNLQKAGKIIAARVSDRIGLNQSKNLVFMKDDAVFENEAVMLNGEETFWNLFCLWKANYAMAADDIKSYVDWLESVIDKRVAGIIGGKYRNKYNDVALLAVALGEVKESLGMETSKTNTIKNYFNKYSRYPAFRVALREYMQ